MITKEDCSKSLQIENRSSFCQRWSLRGFQTSHFICDWFCCKLWLLSNQNNAAPCLTLFPSFCAPQSEVAALFYSNLSRRHFLGQVVYLDLQLCTGLDSEHAVLFLCHISTQRPMTDRKIERSDGIGFGLQQILANSIENFILHGEKKSDLVAVQNLQTINTFSTLELS